MCYFFKEWQFFYILHFVIAKFVFDLPQHVCEGHVHRMRDRFFIVYKWKSSFVYKREIFRWFGSGRRVLSFSGIPSFLELRPFLLMFRKPGGRTKSLRPGTSCRVEARPRSTGPVLTGNGYPPFCCCCCRGDVASLSADFLQHHRLPTARKNSTIEAIFARHLRSRTPRNLERGKNDGFKAELRHAFSTCVYYMRFRFLRNYVGLSQSKKFLWKRKHNGLRKQKTDWE